MKLIHSSVAYSDSLLRMRSRIILMWIRILASLHCLIFLVGVKGVAILEQGNEIFWQNYN